MSLKSWIALMQSQPIWILPFLFWPFYLEIVSRWKLDSMNFKEFKEIFIQKQSKKSKIILRIRKKGKNSRQHVAL